MQSRKKETPRYHNPSSISPTSVVVECLFSESKYVFDDRRLATTPEHIEELMFLRCNHSLWDLQFVTLNVINPNDDDPDEGIIEQPNVAVDAHVNHEVLI